MNNMLFLAADMDDAGRTVGQAVLQDDPEALADVSAKIDAGIQDLCSWAMSIGGRRISSGGDEGTFSIPSEKIGEIEKIRQQIQAKTGFSMTVGIGQSLSEAGKSLIYGKLNGKDQVCQYSPEMDQAIAEAHSHAQSGQGSDEENKLDEAYLDQGQDQGADEAPPEEGGMPPEGEMPPEEGDQDGWTSPEGAEQEQEEDAPHDDSELPPHDESAEMPPEGEEPPAEVVETPPEEGGMPPEGQEPPAEVDELPPEDEQAPPQGAEPPGGEQLPEEADPNTEGPSAPPEERPEGEGTPAQDEQLPPEDEQAPPEGEPRDFGQEGEMPPENEQLPPEGETPPEDSPPEEGLAPEGEMPPEEGAQDPAYQDPELEGQAIEDGIPYDDQAPPEGGTPQEGGMPPEGGATPEEGGQGPVDMFRDSLESAGMDQDQGQAPMEGQPIEEQAPPGTRPEAAGGDGDDELKQMVAEALDDFKKNKDFVEKTKAENPALYQACVKMLRAMVQMARQLGMSPGPAEPKAMDGEGPDQPVGASQAGGAGASPAAAAPEGPPSKKA